MRNRLPGAAGAGDCEGAWVEDGLLQESNAPAPAALRLVRNPRRDSIPDAWVAKCSQPTKVALRVFKFIAFSKTVKSNCAYATATRLSTCYSFRFSEFMFPYIGFYDS